MVVGGSLYKMTVVVDGLDGSFPFLAIAIKKVVQDG